MFAASKKVFLTSLVLLIVLTTGAWQSNPVVSAEGQTASQNDAPLFPGLTWSSLGSSTRNIRINIMGDSVPVSGEGFVAGEQFLSNIPLPEDLMSYYSNAELAKSGWTSYDAFDGSDGVHYVYSNESGVYLFVEFLTCQSNSEMTCVSVWQSEPVDPQTMVSDKTNTPENIQAATDAAFYKTSPTNGATGLASPVTLKWGTYTGAQKYTYCYDTSDCRDGNDWTSTYDTKVTISSLSAGKKYYWQVRALTCGSCSPKTWVYADSNTSWTFTVATSNVAIVGNAGVGSAVLSYYNGSNKTVTADGTGAYSITVPYNWSGTVTPSKTNYVFTPASATFTNLTASQTIQNFAAKAVYYISGNVDQPGVTISYTDGVAKTAVSDSSGNYSLALTTGWSGTITPTHPCYTFAPTSRSYTNLSGNQTLQDFDATFFQSSTCKNLDETIGGSLAGSYYVYSGQVNTSSYAGIQNGPVKISSRYSTSLFTSQRVISGSSFNELMGYPNNQLTTEYWFPWYDNVTMDTWILVANPSTSSANVSIYIGSAKYNYTIPAGGKITPRYSGVQNGLVRVISTNGVKILASERAVYNGSFNEVMGYPANQLTTEYWFPLYDNVSMDTWVLVGNPSSSSANVTIYIGSLKYSYTIPAGGKITPRYSGVNNGLVRVVSTNGVKILTSERSLYGNSFNEVMGYPANQLTTDYRYTWYDNVDMDTWVLVGNPTSSTASVDVYIGTARYSYTVPAGGRITPRYSGKDVGPVLVRSTNGVKILTSQRVIYSSSFNEVMGYPGNQLTTEYWFPWYDDSTMSSDLLVGRP
jgi:hypothetical protein